MMPIDLPFTVRHAASPSRCAALACAFAQARRRRHAKRAASSGAATPDA